MWQQHYKPESSWPPWQDSSPSRGSRGSLQLMGDVSEMLEKQTQEGCVEEECIVGFEGTGLPEWQSQRVVVAELLWHLGPGTGGRWRLL